jgi:hypothetical protein
MSDDAILGKATRKILARMLARVDGSQAWEDLGGEPDTIDGTATAAADATTAALPSPKGPSREEKEAAFREWSEKILAAETADDVRAILGVAREAELFTTAPGAWQDRLVQRALDREAEIAKAQPITPKHVDVVAKFMAELGAAQNQKECGEVLDRYLPPDESNPHGLDGDTKKRLVTAFQDRLAEVRSK